MASLWQVGLSEPAGRASHRRDLVSSTAPIGQFKRLFFGDFLLGPHDTATDTYGDANGRFVQTTDAPTAATFRLGLAWTL